MISLSLIFPATKQNFQEAAPPNKKSTTSVETETIRKQTTAPETDSNKMFPFALLRRPSAAAGRKQQQGPSKSDGLAQFVALPSCDQDKSSSKSYISSTRRVSTVWGKMTWVCGKIGDCPKWRVSSCFPWKPSQKWYRASKHPIAALRVKHACL